MAKVVENNKRFKVQDEGSGLFTVTLKGWYWATTPRLMEALKVIIAGGHKVSFIRQNGASVSDKYLVVTQ
jgi:hypothetical protein